MTDQIDMRAELAARVATIRAVTEPREVAWNEVESTEDTDCDYCGYLDLDAGTHDEEAHQEAAAALALSVSLETWAKIELSGGGPADWLMVRVDYDDPNRQDNYGSPEPGRIVYHYADWGEHDSVEVERGSPDWATLAAFAGPIIG